MKTLCHITDSSADSLILLIFELELTVIEQNTEALSDLTLQRHNVTSSSMLMKTALHLHINVTLVSAKENLLHLK